MKNIFRVLTTLCVLFASSQLVAQEAGGQDNSAGQSRSSNLFVDSEWGLGMYYSSPSGNMMPYLSLNYKTFTAGFGMMVLHGRSFTDIDGNYESGKSTQEELFSPMIEGKTTYFFSDSHSSQGIAKHLGIPFHFTGDERKRFSHCVQVMQQLPQLLKQREIVFMEWNYLWRSTYNGDLLEKIKTIEWFDKNIISQLIPLCKECRSDLVFLPLRPCSIEDGDLLPGTVPALHYSPESIQSHSMKYTEKEFEDCPRYPLSELVNVLNKESMVEV